MKHWKVELRNLETNKIETFFVDAETSVLAEKKVMRPGYRVASVILVE